MKDQSWFEMISLRKRRLAGSVWIPLRAIHVIEEAGRYGWIGYRKEFFGAGSITVPLNKREEAGRLGWMDVGILHEHRSYIEDGRYVPCDTYEDYNGQTIGIHLALEQSFNSAEQKEWHLHQDFVIALGLKRERDVWVRPVEGYIEVARLLRRSDGNPYALEVRSEHLGDYLCARRMALYVTSYRNRDEIVEDASHVNWDGGFKTEVNSSDRWEGRVSPIHEGGDPFGSSTAVFHVFRTDIDPEVDVPSLCFPTDEDVVSESWTTQHQGRKLYRMQGELWRNEWIEPAEHSPRVRGDEHSSSVFFITNASGKKESRESLVGGGRWLWFRPDVVLALFQRRGAFLSWYTRETGSVACSPDYGVHFGINQIGLVNVYAKDIGLLPEWQQAIWAGFNVTPEGGVSDELLASQMKAKPATTKAPEEFLPKALELMNEMASAAWGKSIWRKHEDYEQILIHVHRFRSVDRKGLFELAKDLARLTADSFDLRALNCIVSPPKGEKWRSLKSLEKVVATISGDSRAHELMEPLFGIYELRLADAHLPGNRIDEALRLVRVDAQANFIVQGFQLLHACVGTLFALIHVIQGISDGKAGPVDRDKI